MKAKPGKDSKAPPAPSKAPAAAKSSGKPAAKAVSAAKKVEKPAPKPTGKPALKPEPTKASKPASKLAEPVKKAAPIAAAKPRDSSGAKVPAKPIPIPVTTKTKPAVVPSPPVEKMTSVPAAPTATQPAKAGRPSSRLAQLTVPSMAQTVASTAAKASYTQSTPTPPIVAALPSSIKKDAKLANNWKTTPAAELTDAELMAMPDAEYMNAVQLAAFRAKLIKLKTDILNSAGETTEHLREDTSVVPDPADRATIEEEHALELRTRDRERKLLKKIEQSIARIDAGDYGYCDETGEPIGVGRLLARPTATLSLEAQQRRELKQKMFGD